MLENFPLIDKEPSSSPEWTLLLAIYLISVSVSAKNQLWNQGKRCDYLRRKDPMEINLNKFFLIIITIFLKKKPFKCFIKRPSPSLRKPRSCPSAPETLLSSSFLGEILLQKRSKYQKKIFLQNRSKYHDYHLAVMVGRLGLVMKRPTQTIYNWM